MVLQMHKGVWRLLLLAREKLDLNLHRLLVFCILGFYLESSLVEILDSGICGSLKRGF